MLKYEHITVTGENNDVANSTRYQC